MVNPYNGTYGGQGEILYIGDCFVFKLNTAGDDLVYSTYLGGYEAERGTGIAVDDSGNAHIVGMTWSSNFPIGSGGHDTTLDAIDCFVVKLNATGNGILAGTFIGGSGEEQGFDIALGASGTIYVTGRTTSSDLETVNAYDTSLNDNMDCFVTKLNYLMTIVMYQTYVGGTEAMIEEGRAIAVDGQGNAYVTGSTSSSDFPDVNAYDDTYNGDDDVFVFKLNPQGNDLVYSTFVGGSSIDWGMDIDVDSEGKVYVTGVTTSSGFPTVAKGDLPYSDVFQGSHNQNSDVYVFILSAAGDDLEYSSFFGGVGKEQGFAITVDDVGDIYVVGDTTSYDFPMEEPGYDSELSGGSDIFVIKFGESSPSTSNTITTTPTDGTLPPPPDLPMPLILVAVVGMVLIVVLVIVMKRR
jgi:hypothetical protein